jgi:hypothetical protein
VHVTPDTEDSVALEAWRDAVGAWRPRPLSPPVVPMPLRRRVSILAAVALGHLAVFALLALAGRPRPVPPQERITTLVFVAPEPAATEIAPDAPTILAPAKPRPRVDPAPGVATPRARPTPRTEPPVPDVAAADTPIVAPGAMVAVEPAPRPRDALRLYDADGSLALPDDVVARIGEVDGGRQFDFQMPGLMESGRFMDRQPVLAYEPTRFDRYWIPEKDVLTEILEKAVEATSGTVEIPIPGSPGSKLVCSVSILAMGGGCGIVDKNDGYVVQLDDPDTLGPEEDAQCRAWWDQLVEADTQAQWRETRALYDFSCRKPLAKDTAPPERMPETRSPAQRGASRDDADGPLSGR